MRIHPLAVALVPVALGAALLTGPAAAQTASQSSQDPPKNTADARSVGSASGGTTWSSTATTGAGGTAHAAGLGGTLAPDYRIATGDKLKIEVYKDEQLTQALQVRPDGKITLPLIGDMQAAGLTPSELRDRLTSALKEFVTNPVVTVIVTETVAPTVYVMGEVNHPGAIGMPGSITVMQALAMAGGFKDFANTKKIRILRHSARGVQTLSFNYKDAAKGQGEIVMLQPGDTVIVP
jgi:polysaccharide biosynthesis/export protein